MDLAAGHVSALQHLGQPKCFAVNLGTGRGHSVLEVVKTFERASDYEFKPRRSDDVDACYAATVLAENTMGWKATRSLETICLDHWRGQSTNPTGYA